MLRFCLSDSLAFPGSVFDSRGGLTDEKHIQDSWFALQYIATIICFKVPLLMMCLLLFDLGERQLLDVYLFFLAQTLAHIEWREIKRAAFKVLRVVQNDGSHTLIIKN